MRNRKRRADQGRYAEALVRWTARVLLALGVVGWAGSGGRIALGREKQEPAAEFSAACEHLQRGRYDEALEGFTAVLRSQTADDGAAALVGMADCHLARGEWEAAEELLKSGAEQHPENAEIRSRLAELHFQRGRYAEALQSAERVLVGQPDHVRARLVQARVAAETGRLEQAVEGFRWFVRYYNRAQPQEAQTLLLIAEGAIEYARAKSVSQIFRFVVNDLTPDAIRIDPSCWQAHLIAGNLLLEKFNEGQAVEEFQAALAINPHAADVLTGLGWAAYADQKFDQAREFAERALDINPRSTEALLLGADVALATDHADLARGFADRAEAVNPASQHVLARLAACDLLTNGLPPRGLSADFFESASVDDSFRDRGFVAAYRRVLAGNPAPGIFLSDLGQFLEQWRRWDPAARCYARAIEVAPQLSAPRTALGLLKMRTGELDEARDLLDAAFKSDPFHVRVSNMRKVLGVLDGYETLSTDHFQLRFDRQDRIQAEFIADYLEQIYPELTGEFGYEPPSRTPFELYSDSKNQSAHAWFSARMVGLPWIQTIGASTGMIVALASPTASRNKFDWARVVKHEFSHVLTLQETSFAIPHWYTEALAVRTEGDIFPEDWRRILLRRAARHELFTLESLNQGFQRPRNGDDWQCAYCLSRLYARHMEEAYGPESLRRLLLAYRQGLATDDAIQRVFGKSRPEFEVEFQAFIEGVLAELRVGRAPQSPGIEDAQAALSARPDDPESQADCAWALLSAGSGSRLLEAETLARAALQVAPNNALANAALARIDLRRRKENEARERLERAFDAAAPHPSVVGLLGGLYLENKEYERAAAVFEAGLAAYPREWGWVRALALCNLKLDRLDALPPLMEAVAAHDLDDVESREWLLQRASSDEHWTDAVKWGVAAMHIDVKNAKTHRLLGQAYLKIEQPERARKHLAAAIALDPDDAEARALLDSVPAR